MAQYPGDRGINLYTSKTLTSSIASSEPPSGQPTYTDQFSFTDNSTSDLTVWFKGFLAPAKTSKYLFEVVTNGQAILRISTDSSSVNKVNT